MRSYAEKRDFSKTPEPTAVELPHVKKRTGPLRFVIQRHQASRLHHDFRLELDGSLKSWAVPKGPSLDPKVRRQAIMVEDHPLDYADFEGVIPAGEYGGGEVVLWDEGTYEPEGATGNRRQDEALALRGLAEGKLSIELFGTRLKGGFTLVRTKDDAWLLMKRKDEYASTVDPTDDGRSVRTGLTTEDLRAGRTASAAGKLDEVPGARRMDLPKKIAPMVPTETPRPFLNDLWLWEPKLDGIRALIVKDGNDVRILTRTGIDAASKFPALATEIRRLPFQKLVLDGEIVLLDDAGRPSFEGLMRHYQAGLPEGEAPIVFFAFDLLHLDGVDLRRCVLSDRRTALEATKLRGGRLRILDTFGGDGNELYERAAELGFEGVVGKRLSSPYREGTRTEDWVKVKGYHTEEFVVCGFTEGVGERNRTLGALMLGRLDEEGAMRYCGNVGAGLSAELLSELRTKLEADKVSQSPFSEKIALRSKPTYVKPRLMVEIRFMSWTKEKRLRAPVFVRLRPDLMASKGASPFEAPVSGGEAESVIEALSAPGESVDLTVEGHHLKFSSLSKELWPGLTKRDLLVYYASVAGPLLSHLRNRPMTVVRYPEGIDGEGFFQRHWEETAPEFAETVAVYSDRAKKARHHLLCNNLPTLLWLGQMSALELHPWHATTTVREDEFGLSGQFDTEAALEDSVLDHPTYLTCDLDPNIPGGEAEGGFTTEGWAMTVEAALALKKLLDSLRLVSFVKTTGKSGLHVFVPMRRIYTHHQAKEAARTIGRFLLDEHPKLLTMELSLAKRPHKVYFDANMNGRGKTLAGAYSPRPTPKGGVSMPLRWEELKGVDPRNFNLRSVPALLSQKGDAWADIGEVAQTIGTP